MSNNKALEPGKTFSIKLPVEISDETLKFLNGLDKRNSEILNLIEAAAKEANEESIVDDIYVRLAYKLTSEDRKILNDPVIQKSISAFIAMLIGSKNTIQAQRLYPTDPNERTNDKDSDEDFSDFAGMLDFE
ncbi:MULTISPECIES: hypothetical protein [unclassified Bacillus (in: firmicutes)]|uniref:hypothetical protein n=1 Tax=unclassified Bacillus (in: firmicutes) TaxID=185979 RepID=UPI000BF1E28E|nr:MULTISPECIES: hypothetical protein [unclassified Bacillus (in: firmicutes)]PEJ48129.1 hypothetical protein CN692_24320 [Bacillus sp. AFS002410]PEK99382.1 hypothetical protein CN601_23970 [Bacillus sp. AFS017336]